MRGFTVVLVYTCRVAFPVMSLSTPSIRSSGILPVCLINCIENIIK